MYKRTITGTIARNSMTDLKDSGYAVFAVDTDTGPAEDNARPVSGRLTVSSIRCYATSAYMALRFDGSTGDVLANTNALSGEDTIHAEDFTLGDLAGGLLTAEPSEVYLCVVATSGTGNKANFREGCTIFLEIDYALPPELLPYTDPTLTAGKTQIKAAHMTELQTNINLQREGLGLAAWPFTTIRAGYTSLGDWTAHVEEMRAAITDAVALDISWIEIPENRPTAAVIVQLRQAVEAML